MDARGKSDKPAVTGQGKQKTFFSARCYAQIEAGAENWTITLL